MLQALFSLKTRLSSIFLSSSLFEDAFRNISQFLFPFFLILAVLFKHKKPSTEYLITCGTFAKRTPVKIQFKMTAKNRVAGRLWIQSCISSSGTLPNIFGA